MQIVDWSPNLIIMFMLMTNT